MALDKCIDSIRAVTGRDDFSKEERAAIQRSAKSVLAKLTNAAGDPEKINAIMAEVSSRGEALLARAQRDRALQFQALQKLRAARDATPFAADNPAEWLKALFHGSIFKFEGARNSLAVDVQREGHVRAESLEAELFKKGLHEFADSKDEHVQTQINEALWDLNHGKSLPEIEAKYGKNAASVADVFSRHSELARIDANDAGAWIGKNSDRTFRQTHDGNKIAKAGGNDYGSAASREAWAKTVNSQMDWDEAFDGTLAGATEKERLDMLKKDAGEFISGRHIDFANDFGSGKAGRIGQQLSYQRKYVFKSAADHLAYYREFGQGSTLLENRTRELRNTGKIIALMRRLGARPEETINNFVNDWVDKLNESDPVKAKALSERFNSEMGNTWKLLTGTVGHPSDSFVRRLEASARHTIGVAKTGLSVTSLPTDMVLRASQMADYSGGRLQDSVLSQMKQFTDAAANLSKDDKQWLMAQMGSRWENALRPIDPHLIDHPGFGAVYKFNGHIANSLGHSYWDNTFRAGNLANDANIFAREQHLPFSKVSYMEGLQRFGIGEKEWNVLREVETQKLSDGRPALVPETILETPLEKFRQMVSIKDPSDSLLRRARADLAGKYRNILGELADRATSATSLENQAALHLGEINPNSPYSTVMRWALQLKGWGLNYIRNHLDRELRGHYTNYVSVGQALRDMALGRNNSGLVGLSRLIAKGMVVAYITNSLRQMAMGQTPLNPFDFDSEKYNGFLNTPGAQAAAGAFAKQGLGLYSDWILAQGAPDEKISEKLFDVLGPVPETAAQIGDLGLTALRQASKEEGMTDEQKGRNLQRLFSTGWKMIPGTQAWYSKAALDAMVYDNVAEELNPGFKDRLQQRAQARGYSYWNQ